MLLRYCITKKRISPWIFYQNSTWNWIRCLRRSILIEIESPYTELSWVAWRLKSDLVAESCEKLFRILLNLSMNIPAKHLIVSSQLMNVERAEHFYDAWSAVKCCETLRGGKKSAFVCIHSSMIMEGIFCSSFFIFALISIHDGSWI